MSIPNWIYIIIGIFGKIHIINTLLLIGVFDAFKHQIILFNVKNIILYTIQSI